MELLWRKPYLLLLFPTLFWAGNLLIGRAYANDLPPFGLGFWRWVVASAVLLPFTWRELVARRRLLVAHGPLIVACGASGFAVYPVLNYFALHTTPAATAAMLNSTLPLMVPLLAWAIARERPSGRTAAGIVISFAGVAWLIGRGDLRAVLEFSGGYGELLMLGAVAGYALYSVLLRYRPPDLSPLAFLAAVTTTTAVLLLPCWLAELASGRAFPVRPYSIASVLFIGVFASLLATLFWNRCVATLGSTVTGASFHLIAVYSSVLAFLLLGEPVHAFHLYGMAFVLLGFTVALLPRRATPSANAPRTGRK